MKFAPTTVGPANGTITLVSDDPNGNTTIPLSGTGLGPSLQVSPGSLTFATTQTGDTTATQPVTVQNVGGAALTVDSASIPAPFTSDFTTPVTLQAGSSTTVNVAFSPNAGGPVAANLTVQSDDGEQLTVACTGTGQVPSTSLSTTALTFTQRVGTQSASQPVIVTNTGIGDLDVSSVTATAPFVVTSARAGDDHVG